MATILQLRRGTSTQHSTFTGANGEVTVDTTKNTIVVHDGETAGGSPLATEEFVTTNLQSADSLGELSGTTDDITEGSTNKFFSNTLARGAFSAGTGISITDGAISTSITQYTDALARASVTVTDAGGDGSLSYNNSTGVFTFTGPSATDVRAHFSAGTGIALTNGSIAVDSTIATKTYADNAATTAVANVIDTAPEALNTLNELAAALGDDANFSTTITTSIGTKLNSSAVSAFGLTLVDDADAATARTTLGLGTAATTAATAYATAAQGTKADAALPSADFNSTFDTRLGLKSTTNLTEGTNLYFTNARARDAVSASGDLSYNSTTGAFSFTQNKTWGALTGTPTTIAGYGITDAYTKTQVDSAITTAIATKDNSDEITEGSTNLYFTTARARGAISAGTGISITDGAISTTVTQYTDSAARTAISVTDSGGDGSLTYNNTTGVITYVGPSASDVRAHFSAGTGIALTNGSIAVDSTIATKTYADNAATTAVANVIDTAPEALNTLNELAAALGDDANFATTVTTSIGTKLDSSAVSAFGLTLVDDANAAAARTTLGLGTAATTSASAYATAAQGATADAAFPAADFNSTFDTRLGTKSTTNLTEGTNLYFTNARARGAVSASGDLSYNSTTGAFSFTQDKAFSSLTGTPTTLTGYGITNAYTKTEVDSAITTAIATKDNSDEITEGSTNLYFTTARARSAISAGTGISITNGAISTTITQYTDALARAAVSVTDSGGDGSLAYNSITGVITYTGPSATDVRAHFSAGTGITITNGAVAVDSTIATKTYADNAATTAVAAVIDAAPATLDTLNELAAALGDDANFSSTITTSIGTKLNSSAVSAFGLTLVDDADAATARATLGLGTAATTAATAYATAAQGTKADAALPAASVSVFGGTLIDDVDAAAARTTLGLGTAATTAATAYATAAQGTLATNALPAASVSAFGLTLVDDASASAARTTLGLGTAATTAATDYATAAQGTLATNALPAASYTAADVLTKIKTVDGAGSGLDADLLDGQSSAYFRINIYDSAGTLLN